MFRQGLKSALKAGQSLGRSAVGGAARGARAIGSGAKAIGSGARTSIKTIWENTTGQNLFILFTSVLPFGILLLPAGSPEAADPYGIEEDVGPFLAQLMPFIVSAVLWLCCSMFMCMFMMMFAGAEN